MFNELYKITSAFTDYETQFNSVLPTAQTRNVSKNKN